MQSLRAPAPFRAVKPASRSAFAPVRMPVATARQVAVFAKVNQWPDPEFIKETLEAFPDKGIATVEEARVGSGGCVPYAFRW